MAIHLYTCPPLRHLPDDDANDGGDDGDDVVLDCQSQRRPSPSDDQLRLHAKTNDDWPQPTDCDGFRADGNYDGLRMTWAHAEEAMVCQPNRRAVPLAGCSVGSFCVTN